MEVDSVVGSDARGEEGGGVAGKRRGEGNGQLEGRSDVEAYGVKL